jgi:hypothetical protein
MSLNPRGGAPTGAPLAVPGAATPFQVEADAALARFREQRAALERQVRLGELTPKVAGRQAVEAARGLRDELAGSAARFSPTPAAFRERLDAVCESRRWGRSAASLETLQRETNRLLRLNLIEQQLASRAPEFEARSFVRPVHGGPPAPTLESLLTFHAEAARNGDEPGCEWARRQLEAFRPRLADPADQLRVDRVTDRPDQLNPRTVAGYVAAMRGESSEALEEFVREAVAARDASACAAAFVLARDNPEGLAPRWVRDLLDRLSDYPDAALETLRAWEDAARREDAETARDSAERAAAIAEAEARAMRSATPDPADIARAARSSARPVARPDEPIGLALSRRGAFDHEPPPALAVGPNDDHPEPSSSV